MYNIIDKVKSLIFYDADREFFAKVFPDSLKAIDLLRFRKMTQNDLPAVLAIEQQVYNYPWSENIFRDCFKIGYSCWVCEDSQEGVIGYGILSIAAGEAHIMNICLSPKVHGQGYGRRMMEKLIEVSQEKRALSMFLEVRPSNTAAIALYEKMGFNEIGKRKDYYPAADGGREDAVMLALELL